MLTQVIEFCLSQVIGKSREVNTPDHRLMKYFVTEVQETSRQKGAPLFIVASCREVKKCSADVSSCFLHKLAVNQLTDSQRVESIKWLLEENNLVMELPLEDLARKLHGFRFGDLATLLSMAARYLIKTLIDISNSRPFVIPKFRHVAIKSLEDKKPCNSNVLPASSLDHAIGIEIYVTTKYLLGYRSFFV